MDVHTKLTLRTYEFFNFVNCICVFKRCYCLDFFFLGCLGVLRVLGNFVLGFFRKNPLICLYVRNHLIYVSCQM